MNPFDSDRRHALELLGRIRQVVDRYIDLLGRVDHIRQSGYGAPYWSTALLKTYDTLGCSLREATRLAVLPGPDGK